MKVEKRAISLAIALSVGSIVCVPTYANENNLRIEEVVVTAQKRAQSAQDVGMAISAMTGDTLKDMRITDPSDLALITPGLTFSDSGQGTPVYSLRGVGYYDVSAQASSTVGIYVDEVAIPYPTMTLGGMMDVERVEVLKGPQGTLYGLNTTGGAIKYIANKPSEETEAGITLGYGNFNSTDLEGYLGGALTDTVNARVAYKTKKSTKGWQKSVSHGARLGEKDQSAVRLQFAFLPNDDLDVLFGLTWWEDRSDTLAPSAIDWEFQTPANIPVTDVLKAKGILVTGKNSQDADWNPANDYVNDKQYKHANVTTNWHLSEDIKLTSVSSYQEYNSFNHYELAGLGFASHSNLNKTDIQAVSQELRLSGDTDLLTWVAGLYYSKDRVTDLQFGAPVFTSNTNLPGLPALNTLMAESDVKGTAKAAFVHTEWLLGEEWKVNVGVRYTEDEKHFEGCSRDNNTYLFDPAMTPNMASDWINAVVYKGQQVVQAGKCATINSNTFLPGSHTENLSEENISGRLGVDWTPTDSLLVYSSISRGFKAGGFPTVGALWTDQLKGVKAEELLAYEIGFKSDLLDGAAQVNASAYYYDYENKQLQGNTLTAFGVLGALRNVPESNVKGAEFEFKWLPTNGLTLGGSASYIETEVTKYEDYNELGVITDFKGSAFPYTPKYQLAVLANYQWTLTETLSAFVGIDGSYSDDTFGAFQEDDQRFAIDSYTLWNARAGIKPADAQWRLLLWAKNLSDEFYISNVINGADTITRFNGNPRTYGLSVDWTF